MSALRAIANRTTPVPSLSRLSASTTVDRRAGARSRLNSATTATGSVADSIAPRMKASPRSRPVIVDTTTATIAAVMITPGAARNEITRNDRRSSPTSILYAASNTSPGSRTARIRSGVMSTPPPGTAIARPRPAITSATELGIATRRATSAIPVASASSRMNSSTGRSPAGSVEVIGPPRVPGSPRPAGTMLSGRVAGYAVRVPTRRLSMDLGLNGRRALVGGGGSGIGAGIATALAAEGARVALIGRTADRVEGEAAKLGGDGGRRRPLDARRRGDGRRRRRGGARWARPRARQHRRAGHRHDRQHDRRRVGDRRRRHAVRGPAPDPRGAAAPARRARTPRS